MKKQSPESFGADSHLQQFWQEGDFLDAYEVPLGPDTRDKSASEIAKQIMKEMPPSFRALLGIRNAVARPFGLKGTKEMDEATQTVGFFPVDHQTEDEVLLGFDDKHADFRIIVRKLDEKAIFGTWVRTHNALGSAYILTVTPFHNYISKYWQRQFIRQNEARYA